MFPELKIKDLEKQGYRIVGNHSAIKVCSWTKQAIRGQDVCYKNTFYGIPTWQCVQMTPSFICNHRCQFCWRDIDFTPTKWDGKIDSPKDIVDGCIEQHKKYLMGFWGNEKVSKKRIQEAMHPKQFAISLAGEPTSYPKLPELIDEITSRKMTAFLVSNGTNPVMIKKLITHQPTQLYITLPAPDEETYKKVCNPLLKGGWKKILVSLKLLKHFKRSTIRLTLVKNLNMTHPEKYAELLNNIGFNFLELKAYMNVGYSKQRLEMSHMPLHSEIKEFAEKICTLANLKIIDEKQNSRVILAVKNKIPKKIQA